MTESTRPRTADGRIDRPTDTPRSAPPSPAGSRADGAAAGQVALAADAFRLRGRLVLEPVLAERRVQSVVRARTVRFFRKSARSFFLSSYASNRMTVRKRSWPGSSLVMSYRPVTSGSSSLLRHADFPLLQTGAFEQGSS